MEYYEERGVLVVPASGKLDTVHAPDYRKVVESAMATGPSSCLLDLTEVTFLSSMGLQVLLTGAKNAKREGMGFAVAGMKEMVEDVFLMSGFDRFISHYASKEEALDALQ